MRSFTQPIVGTDLSGTDVPVLAPPTNNSLSVSGLAAQPLATHGLNYEFNETNWEFIRGNTNKVLLAATSVSASTAISVTNFNARGVIGFMNVTGNFPPGSASTTIALKIQAVAPDGTNVLLGGTTAKSISGMSTLSIYPGLSESSGITTSRFNMICPRNLRILASISTAAASFGCVLTLGLSFVL